MTRVAVYGSLKRGFGNHSLIEKGEYIGEATIPGKMYSLGGFPGCVPDPYRKAKVEIFEVTENILEGLDRLEGHPDFYVRTPVETELGVAETYYLANPNRYLSYDVVESGDWEEERVWS